MILACEFCGGIMPLDGTPILQTVESDDLDWDVKLDDERITLHRWPQAKHWYLSSDKGRIFIPDKYSSYDKARGVALRYVPAHRIYTKECAGALPPE